MMRSGFRRDGVFLHIISLAMIPFNDRPETLTINSIWVLATLV